MNYYELSFAITPNTEIAGDVLAGLLGEIGFESFTETPEGINGYIAADLFDESQLSEIIARFPLEATIVYTSHRIESQNWNEEWEKNFFQPIVIDNQCVVCSSFHQDVPDLPYKLIIDPKMAFGTGHHETTSLMISFLLHADLKNKSFLDMGCGTALLAILAQKRGAGPVTAIDNDEWAYRNSIENTETNQTSGIYIRLGDAALLEKEKFDIIFANINRNILLNDIPAYASSMHPGGELYLSGFYKEDIPAIRKRAEEYGFSFITYSEKNNWVAVHMKKE